jgi:hypothetical protein
MTSPAANNQIPALLATLASYEGMFGPYHPQTLGLTTTLALAFCASGRSAEGKPLLRRALVDLTKHHRPDHPVRIRALEAWAALLEEDGDSITARLIERELRECRGLAIA